MDETVPQFIAELRCLATHCEFGTGLDEALRDRLVCGLKPTLEGLQKKVLSVADLALSKALAMAVSYETVEQEAKQFQSDMSMERGASSQSAMILPVKQSTVTPGDPARSGRIPCYRCGKVGHQPQQCRCKSFTCHKCGKLGHIAPVCRARNVPGGTFWSKQTNVIQANDVTGSRNQQQGDEGSEDELGLFNVEVVNGTTSPYYVTMRINGHPVKMMIDTGELLFL